MGSCDVGSNVLIVIAAVMAPHGGIFETTPFPGNTKLLVHPFQRGWVVGVKILEF